jgi:protein-tyrosine phosphatase
MASARLLPLKGGCNFRDMGGYPTADGRRTRWRILFRSGDMAGLTPEDCDHLATLGLKAVCDFRSVSECRASPSPWARSGAVDYWCREYEHSLADLHQLVSSDAATADQARAVMRGIYARLPFEQADAYRALFHRLSDGRVPIVFNCSAGKDRTGLAAALVLAAVDVPQEVVLSDFLLSNETFDFRSAAAQSGRSTPADVVEALGGVHADYLEAAWTAIEETDGGLANYFRNRLGLGEALLDQVKACLLEAQEPVGATRA